MKIPDKAKLINMNQYGGHKGFISIESGINNDIFFGIVSISICDVVIVSVYSYTFYESM